MSNLAIRSIARQVRDLNVAKRGATSLYVDGTNGSDTFTGESWRQAFATIQEAVDTADPWTQIFIKAGTYAENVNIAKDSINLIGQSRDGVKIAPSTGAALTIAKFNFSADSLSTVSNETDTYSIRIQKMHCMLSNIAVATTATNGRGIYANALYLSLRKIYARDAFLRDAIVFAGIGLHDVKLTDSYLNLTNSSAYTIELGSSISNIIVRDNTIEGSAYGIFASSEASDNAIFHNNFLSVATPIEGVNCDFFENYYSQHSNIDNGFGIATEPYTCGSTIDPRPVVVRNGWGGLSWADADQVADILADVTGINGDAMRGTDNAALASVCTEARMAELDAANLPADIDSILANQRKRWNWNCLTDEYMVIAGTWAVETAANQYLGKLLHNTSHADGDEIAIPFFAFSTDAVTLNCRCVTDADGGDGTVYVDGVPRGVFSTYGATEHNIILTLQLVPARAGLNVMRLKATTSHTDYNLKFSELWLS